MTATASTSSTFPDLIVGDTYSIPMQIYDSVTGDGLDASGWSFTTKFQRAKDGDADDVFHTQTESFGDNAADAAGGSGVKTYKQIDVESDDTATFDPGTVYVSIVREITGTSPVDRKTYGPFKVKIKTGN